jgi:hypothetical protein
MRQKIYTVNDFDFKPHAMVEGAVQGMIKLPNNITVSIVGGGDQMGRLYGDGKDTFEVAAWSTDTNEWIKLGEDNEILEYVDKDKLQIILLDLSRK